MKRPGIYLALCVGLATAGFLHAPALAQEQGKGKGDVYSDEQYLETQALIDRMQAKINSINSAASDRDREIEFLNKQIDDAIQVMASGREAHAQCQISAAFAEPARTAIARLTTATARFLFSIVPSCLDPPAFPAWHRHCATAANSARRKTLSVCQRIPHHRRWVRFDRADSS